VGYLYLIWMGLARRRVRTLLTAASVLVAFLLFGLLHGIMSAFGQAVDQQARDILSVRARFKGALPIGYLEQIRTVPGVMAVSPVGRMIGEYQKPGNSVALLMTDPESYYAIQHDMRIAPQQLHDLATNRTGVAVTAAAAHKFGWKIGERIPLSSSVMKRDGSSTWQFDVVGIVASPSEPELVGAWGNFSYYDEARLKDQHMVNEFVVRVADPSQAAQISRRIDHLFVSSGYPTQTRSERERLESFFAQIGDIGFFVTAIIAASFFTLLSMTGHVTMQSLRERIPEFAVMEAMGFTSMTIFGLVLAEVLVLSLCAAGAGLGLAALLFSKIIPLPVKHLSVAVITQGILIAVLVAAASGLVPAWKLRRLSVTDVLSGR
jgi:putative ABC transport system permease protein